MPEFPLCHSFHFAKVSIVPQFPFCHSHHCATVSIAPQFPLRHSFHCVTVSILPQFPLGHSFHWATVSIAPQFPFCHSFHCATVSTVPQFPLCNSFHCATVSIVPQFPLCSSFLQIGLLVTLRTSYLLVYNFVFTFSIPSFLTHNSLSIPPTRTYILIKRYIYHVPPKCFGVLNAIFRKGYSYFCSKPHVVIMVVVCTFCSTILMRWF